MRWFSSDDNIRGMPQRLPGKRILSVPVPPDVAGLSQATLYVDVRNQPTLGVVRVDLVAESNNQRFAVAAALVPVGFAGIVIVATGIACDSWHVLGAAQTPLNAGKSANVTLRATLEARECCGSFSLAVPVELHEWPATVAGFAEATPEAQELLSLPLTPMGM